MMNDAMCPYSPSLSVMTMALLTWEKFVLHVPGLLDSCVARRCQVPYTLNHREEGRGERVEGVQRERNEPDI
jgi:hypothetical protein